MTQPKKPAQVYNTYKMKEYKLPPALRLAAQRAAEHQPPLIATSSPLAGKFIS